MGDTIARANQGIHTEDSAQHGSALTAIDNGEKLQRQLEADAEITREFGKIAPRAINDIAESRGNLREYEQQQLAKATAEEALSFCLLCKDSHFIHDFIVIKLPSPQPLSQRERGLSAEMQTR